MRPKTLQQRLAFFILAPVALLLLAMGWAGLMFAKHSILSQWAEASTLKLQRAAHFVDMQLKRPKQLLGMLQFVGDGPHGDDVRLFLLQRMEAAEGVSRVVLDLDGVARDISELRRLPPHHAMMAGNGMGMAFHRAGLLDVAPPRYDPSIDARTVAVVSELKNAEDRVVGRVEVHLDFASMVGAVESTGWWQSQQAFIVDGSGTVLAGNLSGETRESSGRGDPLEASTLAEIGKAPYGTIFGKGFPPREISGFYKLQEAPWTLVIIAPGDEVLASILRFQALYLGTAAAFIVVILVVIRLVAGKTVSSIRAVSRAADRVARGSYDIALAAESGDEIGDLFQSFNRMAGQLKERAKIKKSLNLAMEVQQNLLPREGVNFDFADIAGRSVYCDEVGGDYYDFLQVPAWGANSIGVAVGDVTGHGVPAALLMTTARALISSQAERQENLADILTDVNRLLCRDTALSGHFMTLFLMRLDGPGRELRWVRAGHDPAFVYSENVYSAWDDGQIVVVATDGVWEAEGQGGARFGRQRLQQAVRRHREKSAREILEAIVSDVAVFRDTRKADDDVTLVVVKALKGKSAQGGETPAGGSPL